MCAPGQMCLQCTEKDTEENHEDSHSIFTDINGLIINIRSLQKEEQFEMIFQDKRHSISQGCEKSVCKGSHGIL